MALQKEQIPRKKYVVRLTKAERQDLDVVLIGKKSGKERRKRAWILLKSDAGEFGPGWIDAKIAEAFDGTTRAVEKIRKRFVTEGFEAARDRKQPSNPPNFRKLDGAGEARLIALACSTPPAGRSRWTLRILAEKLVALEVVDSISHTTVGETLKKTNLSRT